MNDTKNLEKLSALIDLVDTKSNIEEFVAAFVKAIEYLTENQDKLAGDVSQVISRLNDVATTVEVNSKDDLNRVKGIVATALMDLRSSMESDMERKTRLMDEKLSQIKNGTDGLPGRDGTDGKPGKDGVDGSPDTPEEVVAKVNEGKTLIKKERVEGLADFEKLRTMGAFNPTMGPSFSDLADIRKTITTNASTNKAVSINYIIDGGGSAITTGVKGFVEIPYGMTITGWQIFGDQSGSVVVDVWRSTYAGFPPVVGGSIAGSELPTLSNQQSNQDTSLTTWTTSLSQGDIIAYNVQSASTVTRITVSIIGTKN